MYQLVLQGTIALVALAMVVVVLVRVRRRRTGPAAVGAVYDLLNEDRRRAVEIIVEEKAEARDPEDADGNVPDLAGKPRRKPRA